MIGLATHDLRFGVRLLRRSPGFTFAATLTLTLTLTLALSVGATTTLFSLTNAVVLRRLQFPGSDRAMAVLEKTVDKPLQPMDSL